MFKTQVYDNASTHCNKHIYQYILGSKLKHCNMKEKIEKDGNMNNLNNNYSTLSEQTYIVIAKSTQLHVHSLSWLDTGASIVGT